MFVTFILVPSLIFFIKEDEISLVENNKSKITNLLVDFHKKILLLFLDVLF